MKKILITTAILLIFTSASFAATIYTTTIKNCSVEQVQDVLIEIMTGKNFVINEVTPYKLTFDKNFEDAFTTVIFNLLARDANVKMIVTETEKSSYGYKSLRSINHLVPIIKEVRNSIDHTPQDEITNEAVDQLPGSGNEREKKLGLTLTDKDDQNIYRVKSVDQGSASYDAKIIINDKILEINGRALSSLDKDAVTAYIGSKWASGASFILLIEHEGEQRLVTLKKDL